MANITANKKKSNTEVKVIAINNLYEHADRFYQHEKNRLSQFIGKDIFKVDGRFKAKFDSEKLSYKGQLPDGTLVDVHYWFEYRHNCLDMRVKICVNGGSYDIHPSTAFCQYDELSIELFKTKDGLLIDTDSKPDYLSKRFDLDELNKIAADIKKAAEVYELAANKMPYIFKDVFYIERLSR